MASLSRTLGHCAGPAADKAGRCAGHPNAAKSGNVVKRFFQTAFYSIAAGFGFTLGRDAANAIV